MNAKSHQSQPRSKHDIYLLIKPQKLCKYEKFNSLYERKKSLNKKNAQQDKISINPTINQTKFSKDSFFLDKNKSKSKIMRKDSEVSIVDDFIDSSRQQQNIESHSSRDKQYMINISTYPQKDSLMTSISQKNHVFSTQFENYIPHEIELDKIDNIDKIDKIQHFKAFFQYILDFKFMKKDFYDVTNQNYTVNKAQESLSPQSKKLSNSLTFNFLANQTLTEKNKIMFQQNTPHQIHQNRQTRNHELQNSQMSIVDVRVSSASIQDCTPTFNLKHERQQRLDFSPISEMRRQKKVHFDIQNLQYSDHIQQQSPIQITQSENNVTIIKSTQYKIVSLQQLKKRIQNFQQQQQQNLPLIHHGYFCDQCKIDPIVGKRYRCSECDQYDLCEKCYRRQCNKYGKTMKRFGDYTEMNDNSHNDNEEMQIPQLQMNFLPEPNQPLLKKKMSDILQEETFEQNCSSDQKLKSSSQLNDELEADNNDQKEHIHLMEEVQAPKPKHTINLEKILKQTNRCSLRSINNNNDINSINSSKQSRRKSLLTLNFQRQKLLSSTKINKSHLTMSERTIPLRQTEFMSHRLLESTKKQVENLRKSSQCILNLFK